MIYENGSHTNNKNQDLIKLVLKFQKMWSNSSWVEGTSNGSTKAKLHCKTQGNATNTLILYCTCGDFTHRYSGVFLLVLCCTRIFCAAVSGVFALRSQNWAFQFSWNRCEKTCILALNKVTIAIIQGFSESLYQCIGNKNNKNNKSNKSHISHECHNGSTEYNRSKPRPEMRWQYHWMTGIKILN